MLTRNHTVLFATHTCNSHVEWATPADTFQLQSVIAFRPVLISIQMKVGGWVGLGGWLRTKPVYSWTVAHPTTNRARRRVTLWCSQRRNHYAKPPPGPFQTNIVQASCVWHLRFPVFTTALCELFCDWASRGYNHISPQLFRSSFRYPGPRNVLLSGSQMNKQIHYKSQACTVAVYSVRFQVVYYITKAWSASNLRVAVSLTG